MAFSDKNIVITPNTGSSLYDPTIKFTAANSTTNATLNIRAYTATNGIISFEGSSGQIFSVSNSYTGTIFSVSNVFGIPSIEVIDTGLVKMAQYTGYVSVLSTAASLSTDTGAIVVGGGVGIGGALNVGNAIISNGAVISTSTILNILYNGNPLGTATTLNFGSGVTATVVSEVASIQSVTEISDTPPSNPLAGTLWWDSSTANLRIYYTGPSGSQWVDAIPATSGVQTLTGGTDTTVVLSTVTTTVWNTATLQTVTSRGSTTTSAVNITNTTTSTGTATGALVVNGGVGVGDSVYVGGKFIVNETYDQYTGAVQVIGNTAIAGTATVQTISVQGGNNLLLYSSDMSNPAGWYVNNSTVQGNVTIAPDGTQTAAKFIPNSAAGQTVLISGNSAQTAIPNGTVATWSVYMKPAGYTAISIYFANGPFGVSRVGMDYDFTTNTTNNYVSNSQTPLSLTSTPVGNGWYRLTCTFVGDIYTAVNPLIVIRYQATVPNGIDGLYVWGAQVEFGPVASMYTPTTSTVITTVNNLYVPSGTVTVGATTASVSTTTGAVTVGGGVGIGGALNVNTSATFNTNVFVNGNIYWTGTSASVINDIYDLDDISNYTDGFTNTFPLTFNQSTSTVVSPFQIRVSVDGVIQSAFDYNYDIVWFSHTLPVSKGYTIDLSGNLRFADSPSMGAQVQIRTVGPRASSHTNKIYPFKAADILLGF